MTSVIPESTLEKFTTFGDMLRFLRRRLGITQTELSLAVGYSDAQISRLEQNLRLPDIPTIQARFIAALDLDQEPKAVARLLDLAANVRREDTPAAGACPYKGLNHFEESDADLFMGRKALVEKLTGRLISLGTGVPEGTPRFLAILGASGSGKSSLARAGVIPSLRWNKVSANWQIHLLTPTAHPLESLANCLTQYLPSVSQAATLMDDLLQDRRSLHLFVRHKLRFPGEAKFLIVVDQFEEIYALCRSEEERIAFMDNLLTAASAPDGPVAVLIAMRADFYAYCANYSALREALVKNQEYIGAMSEEELRQAIEEPAQRNRWEFEDGLVELLLHEVGNEAGGLPLLSHTLMETWQRRRGRKLTLSGYTASGGIRGAITETAESLFSDRFSQEQQDIARRILLRLTELGDDAATGGTRRQASIDELASDPRDKDAILAVIKVLADARLITTSENSVEVAHEALIREWPRLRGWLEDNRESLRLHRRITEAAREWEAHGQGAEWLYQGVRLIQVQEWASANADEMNALERAFIAASIANHEQKIAEREAQRQLALAAAQKLAELESQRAEQQAIFTSQLSKRAAYLTGAFFMAVLMALIAIYFGSQARQVAITAQHEKRLAIARELSAASLNNLSVDPERSILLALQSISTTQSVDGTILPESLEALHRAIVLSPIRMTLNGHAASVLSADYSPDGKQLATISVDGTVIIWEASSGKELSRITGSSIPNDFVSTRRVAYSPDGKLLLACDRNQIVVYDSASGDILHTLKGHRAVVTAIAIDASGERIASGDYSGSTIIWDLDSYTPLLQLDTHKDAIEGLTFSPDGKWLVTASSDGSFKIWDARTGDLAHQYTDFTGVISGVVFSHNGKLFAFSDGSVHVWQFDPDLGTVREGRSDQELFTIPNANSDSFNPDGSLLAGVSGNDIKLWDTATGRELLTLAGHTSWVMGLAFSPDNQWLASTSLDGAVRIWNLKPGGEKATVQSPVTGFGTRVAYHPLEQAFITNGGDGSGILWDAESGKTKLVLKGHNLEVLNVAISPYGKRIATAGMDGSIRVWDAVTGEEKLEIIAHQFGVRDVAFSPDGKLLASGGFDGVARMWDAETGGLIYEFTQHQGLVLGVAFSPDGASLATCSTDTTVKIWGVKTGKLLMTLQGHTDGVIDVAYNPDGRIIATGSGDGDTILWDATTGAQLRKLVGHSARIQSLAFSPDGAYIATGSEDNSAKVWDVATGQELFTLPGSKGGVTGVSFSPTLNSAYLVIASKDGIVRSFILHIDELLTLAHQRVTRQLTVPECKKYLHTEQCTGASR